MINWSVGVDGGIALGPRAAAWPVAGRQIGKATFCHQALLYAGEAEFVARTASFLRDGLAADEAILVVVSSRKIDRLRSALAGDAASVSFADMNEVGRNPARIIPAWHDFVASHGESGRALRGVGELIWTGLSPAELPDAELLTDIDDLLDEIDAVLEDQSMLGEFRQRSGQ